MMPIYKRAPFLGIDVRTLLSESQAELGAAACATAVDFSSESQSPFALFLSCFQVLYFMLAWRSRISNLLLRARQKDQYELVVSNGHGHSHDDRDEELGDYPSPSASARRRRAGSIAGVGTRGLIWWIVKKLHVVLSVVFAVLAFGLLWNGGIPPLFSDYYELEKHLPQHNLSLPFPEGENGRFVRYVLQLPASFHEIHGSG